MQNQSNCEITFDTQLKTALLAIATKYKSQLEKKILLDKTEAIVWRKSAGLQGWKMITVINFDFMTGGQEIKKLHSGRTLNVLVVILFF